MHRAKLCASLLWLASLSFSLAADSEGIDHWDDLPSPPSNPNFIGKPPSLGIADFSGLPAPPDGVQHEPHSAISDLKHPETGNRPRYNLETGLFDKNRIKGRDKAWNAQTAKREGEFAVNAQQQVMQQMQSQIEARPHLVDYQGHDLQDTLNKESEAYKKYIEAQQAIVGENKPEDISTKLRLHRDKTAPTSYKSSIDNQQRGFQAHIDHLVEDADETHVRVGRVMGEMEIDNPRLHTEMVNHVDYRLKAYKALGNAIGENRVLLITDRELKMRQLQNLNKVHETHDKYMVAYEDALNKGQSPRAALARAAISQKKPDTDYNVEQDITGQYTDLIKKVAQPAGRSSEARLQQMIDINQSMVKSYFRHRQLLGLPRALNLAELKSAPPPFKTPKQVPEQMSTEKGSAGLDLDMGQASMTKRQAGMVDVDVERQAGATDLESTDGERLKALRLQAGSIQTAMRTDYLKTAGGNGRASRDDPSQLSSQARNTVSQKPNIIHVQPGMIRESKPAIIVQPELPKDSKQAIDSSASAPQMTSRGEGRPDDMTWPSRSEATSLPKQRESTITPQDIPRWNPSLSPNREDQSGWNADTTVSGRTFPAPETGAQLHSSPLIGPTQPQSPMQFTTKEAEGMAKRGSETGVMLHGSHIFHSTSPQTPTGYAIEEAEAVSERPPGSGNPSALLSPRPASIAANSLNNMPHIDTVLDNNDAGPRALLQTYQKSLPLKSLPHSPEGKEIAESPNPSLRDATPPPPHLSPALPPIPDSKIGPIPEDLPYLPGDEPKPSKQQRRADFAAAGKLSKAAMRSKVKPAPASGSAADDGKKISISASMERRKAAKQKKASPAVESAPSVSQDRTEEVENSQTGETAADPRAAEQAKLITLQAETAKTNERGDSSTLPPDAPINNYANATPKTRKKNLDAVNQVPTRATDKKGVPSSPHTASTLEATTGQQLTGESSADVNQPAVQAVAEKRLSPSSASTQPVATSQPESASRVEGDKSQEATSSATNLPDTFAKAASKKYTPSGFSAASTAGNAGHSPFGSRKEPMTDSEAISNTKEQPLTPAELDKQGKMELEFPALPSMRKTTDQPGPAAQTKANPLVSQPIPEVAKLPKAPPTYATDLDPDHTASIPSSPRLESSAPRVNLPGFDAYPEPKPIPRVKLPSADLYTQRDRNAPASMTDTPLDQRLAAISKLPAQQRSLMALFESSVPATSSDVTVSRLAKVSFPPASSTEDPNTKPAGAERTAPKTSSSEQPVSRQSKKTKVPTQPPLEDQTSAPPRGPKVNPVFNRPPADRENPSQGGPEGKYVRYPREWQPPQRYRAPDQDQGPGPQHQGFDPGTGPRFQQQQRRPMVPQQQLTSSPPGFDGRTRYNGSAPIPIAMGSGQWMDRPLEPRVDPSINPRTDLFSNKPMVPDYLHPTMTHGPPPPHSIPRQPILPHYHGFGPDATPEQVEMIRRGQMSMPPQFVPGRNDHLPSSLPPKLDPYGRPLVLHQLQQSVPDDPRLGPGQIPPQFATMSHPSAPMPPGFYPPQQGVPLDYRPSPVKLEVIHRIQMPIPPYLQQHPPPPQPNKFAASPSPAEIEMMRQLGMTAPSQAQLQRPLLQEGRPFENQLSSIPNANNAPHPPRSDINTNAPSQINSSGRIRFNDLKLRTQPASALRGSSQQLQDPSIIKEGPLKPILALTSSAPNHETAPGSGFVSRPETLPPAKSPSIVTNQWASEQNRIFSDLYPAEGSLSPRSPGSPLSVHSPTQEQRDAVSDTWKIQRNHAVESAQGQRDDIVRQWQSQKLGDIHGWMQKVHEAEQEPETRPVSPVVSPIYRRPARSSSVESIQTEPFPPYDEAAAQAALRAQRGTETRIQAPAPTTQSTHSPSPLYDGTPQPWLASGPYAQRPESAPGPTTGASQALGERPASPSWSEPGVRVGISTPTEASPMPQAPSPPRSDTHNPREPTPILQSPSKSVFPSSPSQSVEHPTTLRLQSPSPLGPATYTPKEQSPTLQLPSKSTPPSPAVIVEQPAVPISQQPATSSAQPAVFSPKETPQVPQSPLKSSAPASSTEKPAVQSKHSPPLNEANASWADIMDEEELHRVLKPNAPKSVPAAPPLVKGWTTKGATGTTSTAPNAPVRSSETSKQEFFDKFSKAHPRQYNRQHGPPAWATNTNLIQRYAGPPTVPAVPGKSSMEPLAPVKQLAIGGAGSYIPPGRRGKASERPETAVTQPTSATPRIPVSQTSTATPHAQTSATASPEAQSAPLQRQLTDRVSSPTQLQTPQNSKSPQDQSPTDIRSPVASPPEERTYKGALAATNAPPSPPAPTPRVMTKLSGKIKKVENVLMAAKPTSSATLQQQSATKTEIPVQPTSSVTAAPPVKTTSVEVKPKIKMIP